jgi:RHS repeat-associated protein
LTESTTHEYAYDADGNMTSERNKLTGETRKYYWDSENRMIKYEHLASDISPVDTTALYKYDIYGRRLQKDVNGNVINFMWEGDNLSLELNASNQPIRKYFTESGMDDYFAHLEYSEITDWGQIFQDFHPQGWYGYIKDQVGTIYKVWDHNARSVADSRTYDSFGNLISQTGTTKTPLGFQGKYYDQESGLNYFYHRYYNPMLGRFISEDPIGFGGGLNLNAFVNNNPTNSTDPQGLINQFIGPWDVPNDSITSTQISLSDILVDTIMSYEGTIESGYYSCLTNCLFGGITAPAIAKFAEEILMTIAHGGGFNMAARQWYKFKYPTWFKAGGKYSKKLVPDLVKKLSKFGKWVSIYGWAKFDEHLFRCIKDCMDCPKSH